MLDLPSSGQVITVCGTCPADKCQADLIAPLHQHQAIALPLPPVFAQLDKVFYALSFEGL